MNQTRIFPASELEIDDERSEAYWKGQRLELAPESYRVLRLIACNPDKTHSARDIVDGARIGSDDEHIEVQAQFQRIRRAFRSIELGYFPIQVIPRQGYKWDETTPTRLRSIIARLFKVESN
jgi:DNA-binding response OmpR family regulator